MLKVVVIGSGNVAQHLISVFENSTKTDLVQAYARNASNISHLLPMDKITDSVNNLEVADVYIIAVSDDAIAEMVAELPFTNRLVAHTSGSVALEKPDSKNRRGVFYPLQTFSKNKSVDFSAIPLCLESEFESDYQLLEELANNISNSVYRIDSLQRRALHVSAVFVSNFTNHLYAIGNDICTAHEIPFEILKPLIEETADKIKSLPPAQAQTGPAIRNDRSTIESHLTMLPDENQKEIYTLLTRSIQANGKKL